MQSEANFPIKHPIKITLAKRYIIMAAGLKAMKANLVTLCKDLPMMLPDEQSTIYKFSRSAYDTLTAAEKQLTQLATYIDSLPT
jgi:hypothetical protein